jgi:hypothetical protein
MQSYSGFFTGYWDARLGKRWVRVDKWNTPFLSTNRCPTAWAPTISGLDRGGQPGRTFLVHFEPSSASSFWKMTYAPYHQGARVGPR